MSTPTRTATGSFSVTFDDGYASLIELGLNVLRDCGVKALTYLVAGQIGGTNTWDLACGDVALPLMSKDQVQTWLQEGHSVGCHTFTHASLTQVSEATARREIGESKDCLEQLFGLPVKHFCYPYGHWNLSLRELVMEAGYETAVTVEQQQVAASDSPWSLPRWMVYTHRMPWLANFRERFRCRIKTPPADK